jgi:hypothetical protein
MLTQKLTDVLNDVTRKFDLLAQIPHNFFQQFLAEHNLMAVKAKLHKGFAEPTRSKSSNNDVGVKDYLHEMALKTSSSVRNP